LTLPAVAGDQVALQLDQRGVDVFPGPAVAGGIPQQGAFADPRRQLHQRPGRDVGHVVERCLVKPALDLGDDPLRLRTLPVGRKVGLSGQVGHRATQGPGKVFEKAAASRPSPRRRRMVRTR